MDRKLLNYLPPVLREVMEMRAVNEANEPEIRLAWGSLDLVMANQFLDDASEWGVSVWEQELKIRPKDTDTLDERKIRIRALWNRSTPYTFRWLRDWLDGICGAGCHSEWISNYILHILLDCAAIPETSKIYAQINELLADVLPANLMWDFQFALNLQGHIYMGGAVGAIARITLPAL